MSTLDRVKKPKDNSLRNNEYYCMQEKLDKLYEESKQNKIFDNLMPLIMSDENIRLAYRNIKSNNGKNTAGIDGKKISYFENMELKRYIKTIKGSINYYIARLIRRVLIPKANGKMRPLGIPVMTDRLIGQCILQILEPICEAKFHKNSNGFRPNKSCENAISQFQNRIYRNKCYYVVDLDIKSFFDNIDHGKLIKQMWTFGIRDKKLIKIISIMLKAEVETEGIQVCGTPQGGILSPLLANIYLNELDWNLSDQWETFQLENKTFKEYHRNGSSCSNRYDWLRKNTNLKEFYFVRYADDIKILCKSLEDARKLKIAVTDWLKVRLKLEVSEEKTKIVNLKKQYSHFLGFKIRVRKKKNGKTKDRYTILSQIDDKAMETIKLTVSEQLENIMKARNNPKKFEKELRLYGSIVMGIHNYYRIATNVAHNMSKIGISVWNKVKKIVNTDIATLNVENDTIKKRYGRSTLLFSIGSWYIVPISFVRFKKPVMVSNQINKYTKEGRNLIHTNLNCIRNNIIKDIITHYIRDGTMKLHDNIIPVLAHQYGKCFISRNAIDIDNIEIIYKDEFCKDKDKFHNLIIIDKVYTSTIERKCGKINMRETRKKYIKERRGNRS